MCAGTGVSSFYLSKAFSELIPKDKPAVEVVAISCVMSAGELLQSLLKFADDYKVEMPFSPYILDPPESCRFAEPSLRLFEVWNELRNQTGINFDLIYAPSAWLKLSQDFKLNFHFWDDSGIVYIHCGGTEGNESQISRYSYLKAANRLRN
jgi:1-aminocyclopropane-1-carboxylate deaminase